MTDRPTPSPKKKTRLAAMLTISLLALVALAIAGAYVYKQWPQKAVFEHPFEKLEMVRRDFPGVTPQARDAFNINRLHPGEKTEWWYVNAHLLDQKGNPYTMMLTFLWPGTTFFLLSNVNQKTGNAVVMHGPFQSDYANRSIKTNVFRLTQPDPNYFCYNLYSNIPRGQIDLNFCANKPPLAVNGEGAITMGKTGKSAYFSLTNMTFTGKVSLNGTEPQPVKGKGWIDRQWGSWSNDDFDQWQWFSIQLYNGIEIMAFNFIRDGRVVSPFAEIVYPDARMEHKLPFRVKTLGNWYSQKTRVSWSSGWELEFIKRDIRLTVLPDFPDQEVSAALWEGGCSVEGTFDGHPVKGRAFYEERRRTWEDRRRELHKEGVFF